MTTLASIAGEIAHTFDMDPDDALALAMDCVRRAGAEMAAQESGRVPLIEIDEETAREIWEEAALATETSIW
ncbi:hypothetical protein O7599_08255 [Streptomyces sp. WMMC500]|uniref:hypothetical protein n=1 Tax=Streptomyces sp. WMMC500 TaxID=3015154 RepID=UPI00248B4500|nr:hypothetical protein [Streptomyces sp. WMMC500]WBB62511.1 hypothetical protein O7599_08255 [Streptomyces sp. WMMC500]